jgi:16S rRNA (guanine527-N7)-methyltransferase
MHTYAHWLATEGLKMGGIGPSETPRLWNRHLLDSLLLGKGFPTNGSMLDMGSGVGLPGMPLAIAFPDADVILVERSGRRADALHRVAAILERSVTVIHQDVWTVSASVDRVVTRATLPPAQAVAAAIPLLGERGEAWVALGRGADGAQVAAWRGIASPEGWVGSVVSSPADILDSPAWMLRIART